MKNYKIVFEEVLNIRYVSQKHNAAFKVLKLCTLMIFS